MNPPHRSSSVHRSAVPGYRKWYFGAGGSPGRRGMEAAPEPDPLPFEEIHEHAEITVGPPSTSADGYSAHGTFTIPEGAEGTKTLRHLLALPWGGRLGEPGGKGLRRQRVAQVDLKENPQTAGEQGGTNTTRDRRGAAPLRHLQLGSQPDQHRLPSGKRQHLHLQLQHRRGADGTGGQERTRTVSLRGRHVRRKRRNAALPFPVGSWRGGNGKRRPGKLQLGGVQCECGKHGHADVLVLQLRSVPRAGRNPRGAGGTEG